MSPSKARSPMTNARARPSSLGAQSRRWTASGERTTIVSPFAGPRNVPSQNSKRTGGGPPKKCTSSGSTAVATPPPALGSCAEGCCRGRNGLGLGMRSDRITVSCSTGPIPGKMLRANERGRSGKNYELEDPMADEHAVEPPPGTPGQRALGAMESAVRRARESAGTPVTPPPEPVATSATRTAPAEIVQPEQGVQPRGGDLTSAGVRRVGDVRILDGAQPLDGAPAGRTPCSSRRPTLGGPARQTPARQTPARQTVGSSAPSSSWQHWSWQRRSHWSSH